MKKKTKLNWEKYSYKSYAAYVGADLSVTIRRVGRRDQAGFDDGYRWVVDRVFGAGWMSQEEFEVPEDAMVEAESIAELVMAKLLRAFKKVGRRYELKRRR